MADDVVELDEVVATEGIDEDEVSAGQESSEGVVSDDAADENVTDSDEIEENVEVMTLSPSSRASDYAIFTLGGADRYETSAIEALYAFPSSSWAIVASGAGYADAICAAGLAGALNCPIILTEADSLSSVTSDALRQMGVQHVILLGGTSVASSSVESALRELVGSEGTVERLAGEDRYATQMAVYEYGLSNDLWTGDTAVVANATGFADALSISPVSFKLKAPVFFVDKTNDLPSEQKSAISSSSMDRFLITGGTAVMSTSVESFLSTKGSVKRLAGEDRYETSYAIAQYAVSSLGMSWDGTAFTSGNAPYDALGGGPVQGSENSVICLKDENSSHSSSLPWSSKPSHFKFFGGTSVFPNAFKARIALLAGFSFSDVEGLSYTTNSDGWYNIDGKWYIVSGNDFISGWQQFSGRWYYFDQITRAMSTGWTTISGKLYYFDPSTGVRSGSGWLTVSGKKYYITSDGYAATGFQTIDGKKYYFSTSTGAMQTGWVTVSGKKYYFDNSGVMQTGWVTISGSKYYFNSSGVMQTGVVSINGTNYYIASNGVYSATNYHNIEWAGQPNNYYCGPASGYMVLRNVGAWYSASGTYLTVYNVASYMGTTTAGTNFQTRQFMNGMNGWLGRSVYTSVHTPSYSTVRNAILNSYVNGYATVVDTIERRGGAHLNGHNNATFYHIMVVDGYNQETDQVQLVDPGAGTVWSGSSQKFWYSLSSLVTNFMQTEIDYSREHIGVHYAKY